jgi:hypothetical protein
VNVLKEEEHTLRVPEKSVLRKIFKSKRKGEGNKNTC